MAIDEVKEALASAMSHDPIANPASTRLYFTGRELKGDRLGRYELGKESTLHVKGGAVSTAPVEEEEEEEDEDDEDDEPVELSLIQRPDPFGGSYVDFDGRDGWATAQGIDVRPIQEWLEKHDESMTSKFIPYGNYGNELWYLLDRSHPYSDGVALHLKEWFGGSNPKDPKLKGKALEGFEAPENWQAAPGCVLDAVKQLRAVLVDPETGEPLLDEFHLGFAQFTKMPKCKINKSKWPSGLAPAAVEKRNLGAHADSPGYLEVIITIGIWGDVDIQLTNPPRGQMTSGILPRERKQGITISSGMAYALWGASRWKMYHDAIVGLNEPVIGGLRGEFARVGLTLRFCRISFARLCCASTGSASAAAAAPLAPCPPLLASTVRPGSTIVDALYYDVEGGRVNEHAYPHTYPALVLEATPSHLLVLYVSDGLIPDDDDEAWSIGSVPIEHAVLASKHVVHRCLELETRASRMTGFIRSSIETDWGGAAAFVEGIRRDGEQPILRELKRAYNR